jgi:hypothetical protein
VTVGLLAVGGVSPPDPTPPDPPPPDPPPDGRLVVEVVFDVGGGVTSIGTCTLALPIDAVTVAVPTAFAVTTPLALTVATVGSLLTQERSKRRFGSAASPVFVMPVRATVCVWPCGRAIVAGLGTSVATTGEAVGGGAATVGTSVSSVAVVGGAAVVAATVVKGVVAAGSVTVA